MDLAPLITIIIYLVIFGIVLYVIERLVPMDATVKMVIRIVIVLALCLWLLSLVGGVSLRRTG